MSQDEVPCPKCDKLVGRDLTYCIHCGTLLKTTRISTPKQLTAPTRPPTTPNKPKKKVPYKTIIYFAVAAIIDLIVSFSIMNGFALPTSSFGPLYLIYFLVIAYSLGLIWMAAKYETSDENYGGVLNCLVVVGMIIGIPIILAIAYPTIAPSIGEKINNAISEALNNAFTDMFADVEVPGFEPLLFLGVFAMLSIIIMYRYHLKTKKYSLSN